MSIIRYNASAHNLKQLTKSLGLYTPCTDRKTSEQSYYGISYFMSQINSVKCWFVPENDMQKSQSTVNTDIAHHVIMFFNFKGNHTYLTVAMYCQQFTYRMFNTFWHSHLNHISVHYPIFCSLQILMTGCDNEFCKKKSRFILFISQLLSFML